MKDDNLELTLIIVWKLDFIHFIPVLGGGGNEMIMTCRNLYSETKSICMLEEEDLGDVFPLQIN